MKIEIELQDIGVSYDEDGELTGGLRDAVVHELVSRLTSEGGAFYDLKGTVRRQVEEQIHERVGALVQEAIDQPVQRTTRWGEKQGDEVTVRELIRKEIERYLNSSPNTSSSYNAQPGNLTQLIHKETVVVLNREMGAEAKKAREAIQNTVLKRAIEAAAKAIQA
jgi:hypothetical protein